ncbi:MAG: carbamoyltransferase HypF [Desulfopila sp.]
MINSSIKTSEIKGVEIQIQGTVQGVGFRPFIYNLATQLDISGTVTNNSTGVFIQATADPATLDSFIARIGSEAPPLARIHCINTTPCDSRCSNTTDFTIIQSVTGSKSATAIPPDVALCDDCQRELLDSQDRRHGYPFINCTNCGPRFTIVETIPYDRPATSMKVFPMCPHCRREYEDPTSRRFHAQPNACAACGPSISWHDRHGKYLECISPVMEAVIALKKGNIVAIRGLGGFHLATDGTSQSAVARLRQRKNRPTKPLAIMVKDLETAQTLCRISSEEEAILTSPQHPIVLLAKNDVEGIAANLCPGVGEIGIMLPYTPLHHLIFQSPDCPKALVMTSGNRSGCPICISNEAALSELQNIADFFLLHDREILTRVDDSVTKKMQGKLRLFRRARGYAPSPVTIPYTIPPSLGCGGGLKSTFSLGSDNLVYVSQHIGDLHNLESYDFYLESINHHKRLLDIEPQICVRDLHPDYMSSRFADTLNIPVYTVQHHHAHAVAVMAEHGLRAPTLAIILDGTGYGTDGTIWGGEILLSELCSFERLAHLQYLALPGGDVAAMQPWRMALAALYGTYGVDGCHDYLHCGFPAGIAPATVKIVIEMMEQGLNVPMTSSCGRLFDGVAALLGLRLHCDYEGHAALELEAVAAQNLGIHWKARLDDHMAHDHSAFLRQGDGGKWEIISSKLVTMVVDKIERGFTISAIAHDFHFDLVCAIAKLTITLSRQHSTTTIVLSGGSMQNRLLMEGLFHILEKAGLHVYTGEKLPVNDGGISFGQIISGGLQHVSRNTDAGDRSRG